MERGLAAEVAGFILFGGEAGFVSEWVREIRSRAGRLLLIGADLERGAGQQFAGATSLPPAAALGWLDDPEVTRAAAALTAREALAIGVDWVFAPVADTDLEPLNPIVGSRAFSADPTRAARHVGAWVRGCQDAGVIACAKHFPGHGRTTDDSHIRLPRVRAPREDLENDILPFRAALESGVGSVMTAHVAYDAFDAPTLPATLSVPVIGGLLRRELGFTGLVATDALEMAGVSGTLSEGEAAVRAITAGCDLLLAPREFEAVAATIDGALASGRLQPARVADAVTRRREVAARVRGGAVEGWGAEADVGWADGIALRAVHALRGPRPRVQGRVRLATIDDDLGGPHPPPGRHAFEEALRGGTAGAGAAESPVVALYADVRAWKGRPGLSRRAEAALKEASGDIEILVLFGPPGLIQQVPSSIPHVVCAWGGEPIMQRAAAAWLRGRAGGREAAREA